MVSRRRTLLSADAALALLVGGGSGVELVVQGRAHELVAPLVLCALVTCGALCLRQRAPLPAALVCGAAIFTVGLAMGGTRISDALPIADAAGLFILAYSLGSHEDRPIAVLGVLAVALGLDAGSHHVALPLIGSIAPWIAGRTVRSRRHLTDQLALRADELDRQREIFADESVRYERARIARELHDIVAHCLSVIVVQAGAGQRLAAGDPARAAEALDHIAEAVGQAQEEIGRLAEMLGPRSRPVGDVGVRLIDELVARAARAGLPVRCRFTGPHEHLNAAGADAAYGVVQESLTNAFKHAPGAEIDITVRGDVAHVDIEVVNGVPALGASGIEHTGGGHGLLGMRERVQSVGGTLESGPAGAGWRVGARIPCTVAPHCRRRPGHHPEGGPALSKIAPQDDDTRPFAP